MLGSNRSWTLIPMRPILSPYVGPMPRPVVPIALLSALVAVQSVTTKNAIVIDHRLAGLGAAIVALIFKAPFPIVVLIAAITSAGVYNFF